MFAGRVCRKTPSSSHCVVSYVQDTEVRSNGRRVGKEGKAWRGRGGVSILRAVRSNDLWQGRIDIFILYLVLNSVICKDDSVTCKEDNFNSVWGCMRSKQQHQRITKETGVELAERTPTSSQQSGR
jgi:hypothetical protein